MGDNERLCVMEPETFLPQVGFEPGLLDQQASAQPTELPGLHPGRRSEKYTYT